MVTYITINSVKVTFDLQIREVEKADVAKNVAKNVPVNVPVKLTATQQKVLELIRENPSITHIEMSRKLLLTEKTARRTTKALRELGLLKREGSDKNGRWILNN